MHKHYEEDRIGNKRQQNARARGPAAPGAVADGPGNRPRPPRLVEPRSHTVFAFATHDLRVRFEAAAVEVVNGPELAWDEVVARVGRVTNRKMR